MRKKSKKKFMTMMKSSLWKACCAFEKSGVAGENRGKRRLFDDLLFTRLRSVISL